MIYLYILENNNIPYNHIMQLYLISSFSSQKNLMSLVESFPFNSQGNWAILNYLFIKQMADLEPKPSGSSAEPITLTVTLTTYTYTVFLEFVGFRLLGWTLKGALLTLPVSQDVGGSAASRAATVGYRVGIYHWLQDPLKRCHFKLPASSLPHSGGISASLFTAPWPPPKRWGNQK